MKIGDTIECLQTQSQGTIISSRTIMGGPNPITKIYFGIYWHEDASGKPSWIHPDSLKVINPDVASQ